MPVVSKLRLSRSEDALARPIGTARMAHLHAGCRQVDPSCTLAPELDERAHARGASLDANARGGASAYQACKLSDDAWVATREVGSLCASANLFDGATATHDAPAQEARPKALCSNMPAAPATTASAVATVASAWGAQPPGFAVRHGMGHSTACGVVALSSPTARARAADGGRSHGLKRPALSTLSNKMQPRSQPHFGCGLESDAGMDADLSFDSREPTRPPSACHLAEATAAAGHDLALASARRVSTSDNASHSSKLSTSSTQLDFAAIAVAEASALHLPPAPELHAAHGAPSIGKMKGRPLYEPQPTEALHTTLIDSRGLMPSAALHEAAIVFAWWPRSEAWTRHRLIERSCRAIAACRAGIDLVALPSLDEPRRLFSLWVQEYGLQQWQALWYDARLDLALPDAVKKPSVERDRAWSRRVVAGVAVSLPAFAPISPAPAAPGSPSARALALAAQTVSPSSLALADVLAQIGARYPAGAARSKLHLYHAHLDQRIEHEILSAGVNCLGDPDEHPLLGSLQQAKGWLHPQLSRTPLAALVPGAVQPAAQPTAPSVVPPAAPLASTPRRALGCIEDALAAGLLGGGADIDGAVGGERTTLCDVRAPRGYICANAAEEQVAYAALKNCALAELEEARCVGAPAPLAGCMVDAANLSRTKVVLKPTDGLGCRGLVLDAQPWHLRPLNPSPLAPPSPLNALSLPAVGDDAATAVATAHPAVGAGAGAPDALAPNALVPRPHVAAPTASMIVEEMVGEAGGPSPTIYMVGSRVLAIADQMLVDSLNNGNLTPSVLSDEAVQAMARAGVAIGSYLGLNGQWGMDFVLDSRLSAGGDAHTPVIVDLNMGRPNGSLAYFLWRSLQRPPADAASSCAVLTQLTCYRRPHPAETLDEFVGVLKACGLLFRAASATREPSDERQCAAEFVEGVVVAQHMPGEWSTILCVSWRGSQAAHALYVRLAEVDSESGAQYGNK